MFHLRPYCLPCFAYLNHYILLSIPLIRLLGTALSFFHFKNCGIKMAPFSYFTEQSLQALHQSKGFRNFFQHINFTTEFSA